ncbi:hypothetical protein E4T66_03480 [Sinimarinibacterium sp. CAU 1509]|uniref:hypothetical protein n=1 Tax=Sinimarinibacterium sp. CAU 1509 TaxID=2562283 RepID=UPI0010AC9D91|nr:hypothetical protein [Sinimarinibacterium sp. CAU 1509]TJY62795.1 hypothetical protein E4T66_03480 [Sinimarinibacterium sp. CAU 1509]
MDPSTLQALDLMRRLQPAAGAVYAHLALHEQLMQIEWAQEKRRLLKMLWLTLIGFACLLCMLIFGGALAMTLSWNTSYRIPTLLALIAVHVLGFSMAWRRLRMQSVLGERSFAASREALAADLAVIRSCL